MTISDGVETYKKTMHLSVKGIKNESEAAEPKKEKKKELFVAASES